MKGLVVSSLYGKYRIYYDGHNLEQTFTLKGNLNKKKVRIVAGDYVEFDENDSTISSRYDRVSYLKRPEIANIDYLIIVSSLSKPTFSYDLIFKYLTYANANNIKPVVVISKIDIGEEKQIEKIKNVFDKLNILIFFISNKTNDGVEKLKQFLKGRVFCLMGQSGVGKSSLINSIDENYQRAIGEYSEALGRGKHQTKETILLPYAGGFIADTPGFSSLELDLNNHEIAHFYPGFEKRHLECEFYDCLHKSERNCNVKKALENDELPRIVYECYIKLLEENVSYKKRLTIINQAKNSIRR